MAGKMRVVSILGAALLLGGCLTQRSNQPTAGEESCTVCHGDPNNFPNDNLRSAAPPQGVHLDTPTGPTATSDPGVGAHQSHLQPNPFMPDITCDTCHVVPMRDGQLASDVPGHMDATFGPNGEKLPAKLTFGGPAVLDNVQASFDPTALTCRVYCHGVTLTGGTFPQPVWNQVGQGEGACGSCHGLPPAPPHPQSGQCANCHPTVDAALNIVDKSLHINGRVDFNGTLPCNSCHGNADNPAPPVDTEGRSDTALVSVGAHQAHLNEGPIALAFPCESCHPVPDIADEFAHINGVVELVWSPLASADGATPSWDPATATCTSYCHGQTLPGGAHTTPKWTDLSGLQAGCGACHSLPPPAPHPQSSQCSLCHPTVDASLNFVQKDLHVNGTVDVKPLSAGCSSCHGSADNAAPPVDVQGHSDPSLMTVGAHQSHLRPAAFANLSAPIACTECHDVPTLSDPYAHINGVIEVTFANATLANAEGATPTWDPVTGQCSNVYCHGNGSFLAASGDGSNRTPTWNVVNGTQDACGSCHALPPAAPHPQNDPVCGDCHGTVVTGGNLQIANPALHINGHVDF
jgi:predicted CxxxxCH...CXXCH cytochrome family protein